MNDWGDSGVDPDIKGHTTHNRIDATFDPLGAGGVCRSETHDRPQASMFRNSLLGKVRYA